MNNTRTLRDEALNVLSRGKQLFLENQEMEGKRRAFEMFKQGLELLLKYAKSTTDVRLRQATTTIVKECLQDAIVMDGYFRDSGKKVEVEQTQLQKQKMALVNEKSNVSWDDVCGMDQLKKLLHEIIILPITFPELFVGARTPWSGILLYGPPGTGKTFIAQACASLCKAKFYSIQASDLMSKYVGESERLVRQLFEEARQADQAILFIDEVDSLLGARETGGKEEDSTKRVKTEFLVQMQGLTTKRNGLLVIGATNLPWVLDPAIRRRFEKRIYVPLPGIEARLEMLSKGIKGNRNTVTLEELKELAMMTEGYSSADIATIIREAAYEPLRHCLRATHFLITAEKSIPCAPSDRDAYEISVNEIDPLTLELPPIDYQDFMTALINIKPSVNQGDLQRYSDWTQEFGSG